VDIETFALKNPDAGIASIAFAWNKGEGIAFKVDTKGTKNFEVRAYLKDFFTQTKSKLIYHNISFDVCILIHELFMEGIGDTKGLLSGLSVMLKNWDDTKLIAYLATNTCAGNSLGLKDLAQEFAGNYALTDIKDVTKIPLDKLLEYNLVDCLSTWFVYDKYLPLMVRDSQLELYETIFKPAVVDIIQMQLTGLPIDMCRVKEVSKELSTLGNTALVAIQENPIVIAYTEQLKLNWVDFKNSTLKVKRVTLEDAEKKFNPSSGAQLQDLLFNVLGLPILELTENKQPATGGDVLKNLLNHSSDEQVLSLLNALIALKSVSGMLSTFIPAMENANLGIDGYHYLCGSFNLGGTVSGRLSSNNPNMANLPSNSDHGELIKSCFVAPKSWLLVGVDFNSLEDYISALTTKDENKLKVYLEGYDGHCVRAYGYYKDQLPDIEDTVESINSIADKYPHLRQEGKQPTFALTYSGTFKTLMRNCGFTVDKAKNIERIYHELYKQSTEWVEAKIQQASIDGYVTVAFGLRVRTPLLKQVVLGNRGCPNEAMAEARTAGNALGQSWGLLNNRAASEFMTEVRASPYANKILPCCHVHDAQYYLIEDSFETLMFVNEHLINAIKWQEHPDIYHNKVKIGGKLVVFHPSWAEAHPIPNNATETQIESIFNE
jgi:DNA polymerase-1